MVLIGAAVRDAARPRQLQRERALRGLLHRPAQGNSAHGRLRLQDRAGPRRQVRRLRLRDRRVERHCSPADGQGELSPDPLQSHSRLALSLCLRKTASLYISRFSCFKGKTSATLHVCTVPPTLCDSVCVRVCTRVCRRYFVYWGSRAHAFRLQPALACDTRLRKRILRAALQNFEQAKGAFEFQIFQMKIDISPSLLVYEF